MRRALSRDHVVMDPLLHGEQELRVGWLGPEVLHDAHRGEEVLGEGGALGEARVVEHRLVAGVTAQRPPLLLHVRLREPLEVLQRGLAVRRIRHHRDSLAAELREVLLLGRVGEEPDLLAADVRVLVEAGPEGEEVHLHRHLARFEGVQPFLHVGVGHAGRGAAVVEGLVELEPLDRVGRVDESLHLVRMLRVFVLEPPVIEHVGDAHGDAFRAALRVDVGAVDLLPVDGPALEELGDLLELVVGLGRSEVAVVLLLELRLDLGPREPVLAVGPPDRVSHRRQRPVVGRVLRPLGVAGDRGRHEVVELDVVPVLGGAADPLAVADEQVAELALRVELVEEAVREAGPGHEFELHRDSRLGREVLGELDQGVRRVPRGPAQRQLLGLRLRRGRKGQNRQCGKRAGASD